MIPISPITGGGHFDRLTNLSAGHYDVIKLPSVIPADSPFSFPITPPLYSASVLSSH